MIPLLPKWVIASNKPAFYDTESATAIEMVAKLYGSMNSLIDDYNKFIDNTNKTITEFNEATTKDIEVFKIALRQEFQDFIDVVELKLKSQDEDIADIMNYFESNLETAVNTFLNELKETGYFDESISEIFVQYKEDFTKLTAKVRTENGLPLPLESGRIYYLNEDIVLTEDIALPNNITIIGNGHTIQCGNFRIFVETEVSNVELTKINFIGNNDFIRMGSVNNLKINHCSFNNISDSYGGNDNGYIYVNGESVKNVEIRNCLFEGNESNNNFKVLIKLFGNVSNVVIEDCSNGNDFPCIAVEIRNGQLITARNNKFVSTLPTTQWENPIYSFAPCYNVLVENCLTTGRYCFETFGSDFLIEGCENNSSINDFMLTRELSRLSVLNCNTCKMHVSNSGYERENIYISNCNNAYISSDYLLSNVVFENCCFNNFIFFTNNTELEFDDIIVRDCRVLTNSKLDYSVNKCCKIYDTTFTTRQNLIRNGLIDMVGNQPNLNGFPVHFSVKEGTSFNYTLEENTAVLLIINGSKTRGLYFVSNYYGTITRNFVGESLGVTNNSANNDISMSFAGNSLVIIAKLSFVRTA